MAYESIVRGMSERDMFTCRRLAPWEALSKEMKTVKSEEIFRSESARLTGRLRRLGSVELESVKSDSGRFSYPKTKTKACDSKFLRLILNPFGRRTPPPMIRF